MLSNLARTIAICLVTWTLSAASAYAASTVYFSNDSHELLCIAVGSNPPAAGGTALTVRGWNCINQGGTFNVSLDDGPRYVMIKDGSGRDYVARSPTRFRPDQGFAPAAPTIIYGLEILARIEGDFTYRSFFDGDAWSLIESVSTFEDLEAAILRRGFVKVNAWKFTSSDYPGGIGIRLGEFG